MAQASASIRSVEAVTPAPAESAAPEKPEVRYIRQATSMLEEAIRGQSVPALAEAFTWSLALIANKSGPEVTGDILYRLGRNMATIASQDRAEAEAKQVKQEGRPFQ